MIRRGERVPTPSELEHLHQLYRNVRGRNLDLNTFELPDRLFGAMLDTDVWELVLLRLAGEPADRAPVAVGAAFIAENHYVPMIVGLDYDYVQSHRSYRQMIRQMQLRARAHGRRGRCCLGSVRRLRSSACWRRPARGATSTPRLPTTTARRVLAAIRRKPPAGDRHQPVRTVSAARPLGALPVRGMELAATALSTRTRMDR